MFSIKLPINDGFGMFFCSILTTRPHCVQLLNRFLFKKSNLGLLWARRGTSTRPFLRECMKKIVHQVCSLGASRCLPQPPETTTTTGICPAISGATPIHSVLRAHGWILMSLLNLAQSSKLKAHFFRSKNIFRL